MTKKQSNTPSPEAAKRQSKKTAATKKPTESTTKKIESKKSTASTKKKAEDKKKETDSATTPKKSAPKKTKADPSKKETTAKTIKKSASKKNDSPKIEKPKSGKPKSPPSKSTKSKSSKPRSTKADTTKTRKQPKPVNSVIERMILAIGLLVTFVLISLMLINHYFPVQTELFKPDHKNVTTVEPVPIPITEKKKSIKKHPAMEVANPHYEVFKDDPVITTPPTTKTDIPVDGRKKGPQVAIIIDDIGYNRTMARKLANLTDKLTFAVLPNSPHRKTIAKEAHYKGIEIMLHLPMEPLEYPKINPGKNALLASMTPDELITTLVGNINEVPYIMGVNNHMGSRLTTNSNQLYQLFSVLKKKELFFIDSRTTSKSLCRASARLFNLQFAERDIFLDHVQTIEFVEKQLERLVNIAKKHGYAIGIGHPYKVTHTALAKNLDNLKETVTLIHASEIVSISMDQSKLALKK